MNTTMKLEKILVPVDFSSCSRAAVEYARVLASSFSAKVYLVHVVDEQYVQKTAALLEQEESEVARKLCRRARSNFAGFRSDEPDRPPEEEIVVVGVPFQTIALKAQSLPADMIVMGGHGRAGNGQLDKIFFGSNAEKVVRLLPCPVLCVPEGASGH